MYKLDSSPVRPYAITRRAALTGSIAVLCSSCEHVEVPAFNDLKTMTQILMGTLPEPEITRSQVSKLPYATMRAKIARGPRGILALARYDSNDLHWISRDSALFVTRRGRVIRTGGLVENLLGTDVGDNDPVQTGLHRLTGPASFTRWIDTDFENRYQMKVMSKFDLVRRELNYVPDIGWKFTNHYWVDEKSGFVWKSRQYIAHSFGPLELEVLKPAAPLPTAT
jgi:hypothetical protein